MKIAVRGGHNKQAQGANGIVNEVAVDRPIYLSLIDKLIAKGYEVLDVTPGPCDVDTDLYYGVNKANTWGADLFISVHLNALGSTSQNKVGSEVCVYSEFPEAVAVAQNLYNIGFTDAEGEMRRVNTKGLVINQGYYELCKTNMKAMIVECFFCNSVGDVNNYNRVGHHGIAQAIADGISGSASPAPTPKPNPTPTPKPSSVPSIIYQTYTEGRWLPKVRDTEDYAGIEGCPVVGILADATSSNIYYRVHLTGGDWLPYVRNMEDFAGASYLNKSIDGIQMQLTEAPGYGVEYRAHIYSGWLPWVRDLTDYAGIYGINIDAIQARAYKK